MAKRDDEGLFDRLAELPWWVSIAVGVAALIGLLAMGWSGVWWFSLVFLIPAGVSAVNSQTKRARLDAQTGIESINAMSWKEFEELLGEAFRREGYSVSENTGVGPDGGIDLVIRRGGSSYLVQCKQWRTYTVGVKVVREMLGLVTAHSADGAIVVTSGRFTAEAQAFAAANRVELIDGEELLSMIRSVQRQPLAASPARTSPPSAGRVCPKCGSLLVLRTAKRGANAGGQFWGCSSYPKCRHTEEYTG